MSALEESKRRTNDVKRNAHGHWDQIYSRLCPQIAAALAKPGRHVTCPFHGGTSDFRVTKSYTDDGQAYCTCGSWDGFALLMHANRWTFNEAVDEVEAVIGGRSSYKPVYVPPAPKVSTEAQLKKDENIKKRIKGWWEQTLPLSAPEARLARLYLRNRKLGQVMLPLDDIGFHPSLEYYNNEGQLVGNFPALVSIVRMLSGSVSTVHRTWLSADGGKAPVDEPRKQYSSPKSNPVFGAAIRLDKHASPVLHVGEGLESALAVRAIIDGSAPVWSTLNKELMRGLDIPDYVKVVCIWSDRDTSYGGQSAAIELMERVRASGRKAVVMLPPFEIPEGKKSIDWNDIVESLGLESTRNHFKVVKFTRGLESLCNRLGIAYASRRVE